MQLSRYAKAIVGALTAGLGALQTAQLDNHVTTAEWITVASATVAALGLVWGVQNAPTTDAKPHPQPATIINADDPAGITSLEG